MKRRAASPKRATRRVLQRRCSPPPAIIEFRRELAALADAGLMPLARYVAMTTKRKAAR